MRDWLTGGWLAMALVVSSSALAQAGATPAPGDQTSSPKIVLPALPPAPAVIRVAPHSQAGVQPPSASPAAAASAAQQQAAAAPPPPPLKTALAAFVAESHGRDAREIRDRREQIAAFYAARGYAPLWLSHGEWTNKARAVVARLEQADADGLSAAALRIPTLGSNGGKSLLATELALTDSVVRYGEEASGGRIDPRMISSFIAPPHSRLAVSAILGEIANSSEPTSTLDAFNPPQPGYKALRVELAKLRGLAGGARDVRIPPGRILRIGVSDPRVPLVRARLGLEAPKRDALVYDKGLAQAVAAFQRSVGLTPTGALTPLTARRLSGRDDSALEDEIVANMELWRWTPRDMGTDRIEVNIPDFSLSLYHGDQVIREARVVVGKPTTPTPLFSDLIRYVIVNPSWIVPQSIIKKEMLPKLATDPNYFQEMGYIVTRRGSELEVRQPPGPRNALGRIKFLFPNDYAVYLHDTPDKYLFKYATRAFSHGCVRVQDPFALGQDVLKSRGWTEAKLERLIGDEQHTIRMPHPLPIHLEYFTTFVNSSGRLETRPDIYGYVQKIEIALARLDGVAPPRAAPLVARAAPRPVPERRQQTEEPLELE